jgi:hypothetical protein
MYDFNYLSNHKEFKLFEDSNSNCFPTQSSFNYTDSMNRSVTIFSKLFQLNQSYQFMVHLINRQNPSFQSIGYLFVKIENIQSPLIMIRYIPFF